MAEHKMPFKYSMNFVGKKEKENEIVCDYDTTKKKCSV